jgi:hypothetical protein
MKITEIVEMVKKDEAAAIAWAKEMDQKHERGFWFSLGAILGGLIIHWVFET